MTRPLLTVKAALQAYVDKDRAAIERLIGEPYAFTSPLDNRLDRATYFARCWPNSEATNTMTFVSGTEDGELAWVVYEGTAGAKRFRNCEMHRVRDGRIVETEVYFGWNVPHDAPDGGFVANQTSDEQDKAKGS